MNSKLKFNNLTQISHPATSGVFVEAGNALSSCLLPMTLDTQMTLDLLQELLMALRANDSDGYKSWLAIGIEQLGRDVAGEVESDWMVPFLVEEERERLMAWHFRRKSPWPLITTPKPQELRNITVAKDR